MRLRTCSADTRREEKRDALAVVNNKGEVMWIPPAIYKSTCEIDITHFPFDKQQCNMKFGSWTYDGFKLDLDFYDEKSSVDLTDYVKSNEWTIIDAPARRNVKRYPCCIEPYPDLTFTILIKRQPAFYNYILILPCVLLSSLTLVLFWLPPESPAKMVLGKYTLFKIILQKNVVFWQNAPALDSRNRFRFGSSLPKVRKSPLRESSNTLTAFDILYFIYIINVRIFLLEMKSS